MTFERHTIISQDTQLSVLEVGASTAPTVLMLHGLRDSAHALLPVAEQYLAQEFRVLLLELRGHGQSDRSPAYAMPNMILDVYHTLNQLAAPRVALFGHSLGGHLVTRFAALFPEWVSCVVVAEGMGPPQRPHEGDPDLAVTAYRNMLLNRMVTPRVPRPLRDADEARERLLRNNPRLDPALAEQLVPHLTHKEAGVLQWSFDPLANSVFLGTSNVTNEAFWRQVSVPVCCISGQLSYEYWGREFASDEFSGRFAEGEMEQRVASFPQHEHHWFDRSGHMIHYDEPDRLGELCKSFLEQHHV